MTRCEKQRQCRIAMGLGDSAYDEFMERCDAINPYDYSYNPLPGDENIERLIAGMYEEDNILPMVKTTEGALQALFSIEDVFGMSPIRVEDKVLLGFDEGHYFNDFLYDWESMRDDYESGECTRGEYTAWRASYI